MESILAVFYMFLGAGCYVIGRGLGNMIFDIMELQELQKKVKQLKQNENKTDI